MNTTIPARFLRISLIGATWLLVTAPGLAAATASAGHLRCEYNVNPTAVSAQHPRFSWIVTTPSSARGVLQSAYRIIVASQANRLEQNQGDVWDSGKVASPQSVNVEYAGPALVSARTYLWKVQLWDQAGAPGAWSEPAHWTMGLLNPGDWKARWIGADRSQDSPDDGSSAMKKLLRLQGQKWIWVAGAAAGSQPAGKSYFRKVIQIPADQPVQQAVFLVTADDAFQLFINGQSAGQGTSWQTLPSLDVTKNLHAGTNVLAIEATNGGDAATPAGLVGRLVVLFSRGDPLIVPIDTSWQSSSTAEAQWQEPAFDAARWKPAAEIASFGAGPWGEPPATLAVFEPAPYFRKPFTVSKPVRRAIVFASALGVYELRLNGSPVDSDVLSPGWTDYRKRVHYFGYDVTKRLQTGSNALGAILGDGWYAGYLAFTGKRQYYGDNPRFIAQLEIEFEDGTRQTIATDETWKTKTSPVLEGDMLMGCVYDARREMPGWDAPNFNEQSWRAAAVDPSVKASLQPHPGAPIRRIESLPAKSVTEPKPGVYIFDLGQNIVGWVALSAQGTPGQKVVLRHAEMLNPDGTLYTTNLRAARATDTFYLAGENKRAYEPYFTFHGFQYVEVTGLEYRPKPEDVQGIVVHSDLPRAATFQCSEPLVNKLTLNSLWGQKGNFLDVPTDCPQRDERAGWTGDAQVFMKTACFNMDAPAFYTKWLVDLCQDSQRADGAFGDVAPHVNIVSHGNTGWSDAGPVCNWQMYQMYGDTRVLQQHYDTLVRHMAYLEKTSTNHVRGTGAYGDWLRLAGPQHSDAIGTAYYFYTSSLMADIATALHRTADAEKYRARAQNIRSIYVERFIKPDGQIIDSNKETGQTFYALAFGLGLVPEEMKSKTAAQFVASIEKENDHLATGFLGTPFVLFALQKAGQPELAYKLVLNKTYPSWLQQVLWGSTTMWERWDGWRPDKGFQDPGMNSFNHYWLGCVSEWLFTQAAGIDTDGPGFARIRIQPEIVPAASGFSWVDASYDSIRGAIRSAWKIDGRQFSLNVTVPGNCTARVIVPAKNAAGVRESGQPASRARGVRLIAEEGGRAIFEVGSGEYSFHSTW